MDVSEVASSTKVSLVKGASHHQATSTALNLLNEDIERLIGSKRSCTILIKPNMVLTNVPKVATHVETLRAILDHLGKYDSNIGRIVIGEGPADGGSTKSPASSGYRNYGYERLSKDYAVEFMDLNQDSHTPISISQIGGGETAVRVSNTALRADIRVSVTVPKTHETVLFSGATKNIVMGSVLWDNVDDKIKVHGFKNRDEWKRYYPEAVKLMHKNIVKLAKALKPDLSVIDAFGAMEGNGPVDGSTVNLGACIAGTDSIAADSVAASIMGFNPSDIGYLYLASKEGLGVSDLSAIELLGSRLNDVKRSCKPHPNHELEMSWKQLIR